MTRHYAFVPGLGGFMFQEEPARFMLGGRLMPPLRILKYNRFLNHDDGMLANVIMRAENLNYDDANQAIRLSVSNLLNEVQHEGRCALGRLGFVFFDEDCHIAFRANDQVRQDPVYYGMTQLNVKPWREVEAERNGTPLSKQESKTEKPRIKHHDGILELPTHWVRYAAIALIVICFIVGNMIPWKQDNTNSVQCANVVGTDCLLHLNNTPEPQTVTDISMPLPAETKTDEESAVADVPTANPIIEKETTTSQKEYIVIIASCKSEKECNRLMRRLAKKGYEDLHVYERNGKFRIYINKFAAKSDAVSYMNNLRETTQFSDAWLLGVRREYLSLSYNIKNKDNDQLPMELSHFNSTAERDQG